MPSSWRVEENKDKKPAPLVVADAVIQKRFPITADGVKKVHIVEMPQLKPGAPVSS